MLWNHSKINGSNQLQAILERSWHLKKQNVLQATWIQLPTASLPPLILIHPRTFRFARHGCFLQSKVKSRWARWKINQWVEALSLVRSDPLCAVLDEQRKQREEPELLSCIRMKWGGEKWALQLGRFWRRYLPCSVSHALGPVTESYKDRCINEQVPGSQGHWG